MAGGLQGSAEQLYGQADVLQSVVARFRTGEESARGGAEQAAASLSGAVSFVPQLTAVRPNGNGNGHARSY
jgi:hypothetical protein